MLSYLYGIIMYRAINSPGNVNNVWMDLILPNALFEVTNGTSW